MFLSVVLIHTPFKPVKKVWIGISLQITDIPNRIMELYRKALVMFSSFYSGQIPDILLLNISNTFYLSDYQFSLVFYEQLKKYR